MKACELRPGDTVSIYGVIWKIAFITKSDHYGYIKFYFENSDNTVEVNSIDQLKFFNKGPVLL